MSNASYALLHYTIAFIFIAPHIDKTVAIVFAVILVAMGTVALYLSFKEQGK